MPTDFSQPLSHLHILIIEDDRDLREALELCLSLAGYKVSVAENASLAWDLLCSAKQLPNLILLDLGLPVMDGFEFRIQQLEHDKFRNIPIVILTAFEQKRGSNLLAATDAYLQKPVSLELLLNTIRRCLQQRDLPAVRSVAKDFSFSN